MYEIKVKRVYEEIEVEDGFRILVDRIWPRGISKESAKIDLWEKEIAPSTELRKWYSHVSEQFIRFSELYENEINENFHATAFYEICKEHLNFGNVTLLYASASEIENNAKVLYEWLMQKKNSVGMTTYIFEKQRYDVTYKRKGGT